MEAISIEGERREIIDHFGEMKEERDLLKRRSCDNKNDPRPCSDPSSVSSCDTDRTHCISFPVLPTGYAWTPGIAPAISVN